MDDFKIYGLNCYQILELREYWLKNHIDLPPKEIKPKSREEKLEEFVREIIGTGTYGMWSCELIKKAKELLDDR